MGVIWELIKLLGDANESIQNEKKRGLEKEMNLMGLEEHEKKLVREGKYDIHNFEDNDIPLDEDDYYADDTK